MSHESTGGPWSRDRLRHEVTRSSREFCVLFYPGPDQAINPEGCVVIEDCGDRVQVYYSERGRREERWFADEPTAIEYVVRRHLWWEYVPLSDAVRQFVGKGTSPFPRLHPDEVLAEFGPEMLTRVQALVREVEATPVDWSHGLSAAADAAADGIRSRHPDLADYAIDALRWYVSYVWR